MCPNRLAGASDMQLSRCSLALYTDFEGQTLQDLKDVNYKWENVFSKDQFQLKSFPIPINLPVCEVKYFFIFK